MAKSAAYRWQNGKASTMSAEQTGVSAGPARQPREHPHDSTRADGWLDTHCLLCGADGYWLAGERIDPAGRATEVHPSGKVLVAVDG